MSEPMAGRGPQPPAADELRRMLDDLLLEGERLTARAQEPAPRLRELLGLPADGAVTIRRDSQGLIGGIAFDWADGERPAHAELMQQLNLALFDERAALGPSAMGPATSASGELAPELRAFMASVDAGGVPEPVAVTNDLSTVTVRAVLGEVVAIDCSPSFVRAASDETLAAEIVRVARDAALRTDLLGKYRRT